MSFLNSNFTALTKLRSRLFRPQHSHRDHLIRVSITFKLSSRSLRVQQWSCKSSTSFPISVSFVSCAPTCDSAWQLSLIDFIIFHFMSLRDFSLRFSLNFFTQFVRSTSCVVSSLWFFAHVPVNPRHDDIYRVWTITYVNKPINSRKINASFNVFSLTKAESPEQQLLFNHLSKWLLLWCRVH